MNNHSLIAIDLAKNIFQACILDEHFNVTKNVKISRAKLLPFILTHQASQVVMEAC